MGAGLAEGESGKRLEQRGDLGHLPLVDLVARDDGDGFARRGRLDGLGG